MSEKSPREWARQRLDAALEQYGETLAAIDDRDDPAPRVGDLYVLTTHGEHGIEWLLLEQDQDGIELMLADTNPLLGPGDVAVPTGVQGGPLSLRTGFLVRLPSRDLVAAKRTGAVDLAVVSELRESSRRGSQHVDIEDAVADDDEPAYRRWIADVVEPAHRAIARRPEPVALSEARADASTPASTLRSRENKGSREREAVKHFPGPFVRRRRELFAIAALCVLAVGLGSVVMHQRRQIQELEERASVTAEAIQVNVPLVWLGEAETQRSEPSVVETTAATDLLVLILEPPALHDRYRLEIRSLDGEPLWSTDELAMLGVAELSVVVPRRLFNAVEHLVLLYGLEKDGLENGEPVLLAEYRLKVTQP